MKSVALVIRSGPTQALGTREMIDMALVLATFDCPVSVVGTILVDQESCSSWDFEPPGQFPGSIVSRETIKRCLDDSDVVLEA